MADAYRLKLDTISQLQKVLNGMSKYKMTCVDGYLWNALVVPQLNVSEIEIKEAYEKMNKVFYLTVITCPDSSKAIEYIEERAKQNGLGSQMKIIKNAIDIKIDEMILQWPFFEFYDFRNYIFLLNTGQISKPLSVYGNWILIYVNKIDSIKRPSYQSSKETIVEILKETKEANIALGKEHEFLVQANYSIENSNFSKSLDRFKYLYNQPNINDYEMLFKDIYCEVLIHYKDFNKNFKDVTIGEFNDYYFYQPIRGAILDSMDYIETIRDYIIDEYMWNEGLSLGLLNNEDQIYGYNWFKNKQMDFFYRKKVIDPMVNIDSQEIRKYYDLNIQEFYKPIKGYFSSISFNDQQEALNCMTLINNQGYNETFANCDLNIFPEFIKKEEEIVVDYENSEFYKNQLRELRNLDVNKPQMYFIKDEYRIIYKLKEDSLLMKFEEAKNEIEFKLHNKKITYIEDELIYNKLKQDFRLESSYKISKLVEILLRKSSDI